MEHIDTYINFFSAVLIFFGLIYAGRQLSATKAIHEQNHDWNRRVNSLKFSFADDPKLIEILSTLDLHFEINSKKPGEIKIEEMEEVRKNYPTIYNDIHFALARLEVMCIAMEHRVASKEICKALLRTRVITFNRIFRPYIEQSRKKRGADALFINLEKYAADWSIQETSTSPATGKI